MGLTIRTKFIGSFGLILAVMAVVGWRGIAGMGDINDALNAVYADQFTPAQTVADANADLLAWNRALLNHILAETAQGETRYEGVANEKVACLDENLRALSEMNLSEEGKNLLRRLRDDVQRAQPLAARVLALSNAQNAEAQALLKAEFRPVVDRMDADMTAFLNLQEAQAKRAMALTDDRYAQGLSRILWIIGIALAGSALVAYLLGNSIVTGVNDMVRVAGRVAEGDLSMKMGEDGRSDEIGALQAAFREMVASSQEMADAAGQIAGGNLTVEVKPRSERDALGRALADMAAALRSQIRDMVEGANTLASAISEILASTTQLASGASETATAVGETTTTVEEVKQTAQLSSQKSQEVSGNARTVAQTAQTGRQATDQVAESMAHIRKQMETVAESIVRLSEQGQTIGDIISTVDDLSEQSNLLAVNAAIEAAKAGDEGKGFGVVAEEIKSLAEQSKQSTGQVRGILNEIQKATGTAVMAAEQASKAVEAGGDLSDRAGEAVRTLSDSVSEAAQAAVQIAASSQQQMAGVEQVALAMENIREASSQNAASTQQVEVAARNLDEVGRRLKDLVAQYRV